MKVTINQKGVERIQKGHAWIFRSDLLGVEAEVAGVATVLSPKGRSLGQALYSPKSLIALRMMTSGAEKITSGLIAERIREADVLRRRIFPESTVYRAVFGEGDRLPSLIVDRFADILVFQTLSAGMETFKDTVIQILLEHYQPRSIVERNDVAVRGKEELPLIRQVVFGEDLAEAVISLGGQFFGFNPLEGQKTGFFLDQRFNALEAARFLEGDILDAFCYVGQFSIHAAPRASRIECVDSSAEALHQLEKNARANERRNLETVHQNVFDYLKACDGKKRTFDGICLDPPAFVKGRSDMKQALRGYKEINLRAMRLLKPGGILVTSSCSQNLSALEFENTLGEASRDTRRQLQVLARLGQPPDHPSLIAMPETNYLKCYILRVI